MNCRYIYNNRTFLSEAELDEYLIVTSALKPILGDMVFQWKERQLHAYNKIKNSEKSVEQAMARGLIKESSNNGEPEDLDNIIGNGQYKTVTDLIHEIRIKDATGTEHPLFEIFLEDEYWIRQYDKYRNGEYDDKKVIAQLPFLKDIISDNEIALHMGIRDNARLEKIRERMTEVWKQQALCGDLVHALLSEFYRTKTEGGKRFSSLSKEELRQEFENKILEDYYSKFKTYASSSVINSIIDIAFKVDDDIHNKYGQNCMILSEKKIVGTGVFENNSIPIVGKMDLFIISEDGKMAILDYKCSPKEYTEFNRDEDPAKYDEAKIRTFQYLLAAYRKLLNSIGINPPDSEIELAVIPLKFENFRWDYDNDKVVFDSLSTKNNSIQVLPNSTYLSGGSLYSIIEENLELIFPNSLHLEDLSFDEILDKVSKEEKILFKHHLENTNMTDEKAAKYIKDKGGIKKNKSTGNWEFKYGGNEKDKDIVKGNKSKEEAEIIILNKVKERHQKDGEAIKYKTASIRKAFKLSLEGEDVTPLDFGNLTGKKSYSLEDPLWLLKLLGKYNDNIKYEILSKEELDPILDHFGILLFKNKITGAVDIVKISAYYDPRRKSYLGGENVKNRNTLFGTFIADEVVNSDSNSQAMDSVFGNIELMETMLVMNKLSQIFLGSNNVRHIGRIELLSTASLKGLTATNELLLYNFRRLCLFGKIENNFVDEESKSEGKILMADHITNCKTTFSEILESPSVEKGLGKIDESIKSEIHNFVSDLDSFEKNPVVMRRELMELDKSLIEKYPQLKQETGAIQSELENPEYKLHRDILFAIAQLSGVKLYQLIEDHAKFTLANGISGTEIDNPGTLLSKTLNEFTDQVTIAYQNVRDNVIAFNQELRKRVEKLKQAKGFGLGKQYIAGNQVLSLYMNMFDKESDDLMFVNPWDYNTDLDNDEREFLKFAILKINDNRIKGFKPENIETLIQLNPAKYLRVPLTKGDLSSEVAVRKGWLEFIKSRFSMLLPSRLKERFDKAANNLINELLEDQIKRGEIWEAINYFEATETDDSEREKAITEYRENLLTKNSLGGEAYFEHNIETLLLKHTSAYKMADELNNIFPVLRALTLNLNSQGAILNEKFKNDLEYVLKYVKTRIHNQPVENRENGLELLTADTLKVIMKTASKLALAFNPRQWYQFVDGIWKDCQIYFRNAPEEGTPFTREGLLKGWKLAMRDIRHFGNDFTMGELLNQQYGFNDMDANSYIDRIKTDNTGLLYHFWSVGFRFASRPDYYNRMTIFYAQMLKDGSLDAHKMVDGKLVYDWKLDKRFDAFAKGDKSDMEKYNKLKSLYITMARQFELEGVVNSDGTKFQLDLNNPVPFPKAYTNKLSESMKALSDRIYGYYAHEKKSMIHSSLVGSMLMQMNTYWSAKKNQYAQTRSYTQEGEWVLHEENGLKYYWKEDEDGDLIPVTENTGVPVMIWKGRPQEGIFLTGIEVLKAFRGSSALTQKSGIAGVRDLLNNEEIDPQIRRLYSSNMRQLISDFVIWMIIGNLFIGSLATTAKEYAKQGNESAGKAVANTLLSTGTSILMASTRDANFVESIFGRGTQWTPFAIQSADRLATNLVKVGTGKLDLYDFLIKSNGAGNSTKPMWDYVKISTFGEKIGERKKKS